MYNITENIYYSQLSSVAILLQPERKCFTSYNTRKGLCSLSSCAIALRSSPSSHVSTCNGQRSLQLLCVHCTDKWGFRFSQQGVWRRWMLCRVVSYKLADVSDDTGINNLWKSVIFYKTIRHNIPKDSFIFAAGIPHGIHIWGSDTLIVLMMATVSASETSLNF
jgi:hypothetical protein